jgi:hypothetical protein
MATLLATKLFSVWRRHRQYLAGTRSQGRSLSFVCLVTTAECFFSPFICQIFNLCQIKSDPLHIITATAINFVRINEWLCGHSPAQTRQSAFVKVMKSLAPAA